MNDYPQVGSLSTSGLITQLGTSRSQEGRLAPASDLELSITNANSPTPHPEGGLGGRNIRSTIGANATGSAPLSNGGNGISIIDASHILIGGDTSADRNIISGNIGVGVMVTGDNAEGNLIKNNYIGTDVSGDVALGNGAGGLETDTGDLEVSNCVISGNGFGSSTSARHDALAPLARGLALGRGTMGGANGSTPANSTSAIPNGGNGISIVDASNIQIGGASPGEGNTIAYNNGAGILVTGDSVTNPINGNSIFANTGGGIDIGGDGPTANDPCDTDTGPALSQNYPVLTFAHGGGNTGVTGSLNSTANASFTVDFFAGDAADATLGSNQTYLGSTLVSTDATCNGAFNVTLPVATAPGNFITATATDAEGNTSEFSSGVVVNAPTAAPASISGRITTANGEPLAGVMVTLNGNVTNVNNLKIELLTPVANASAGNSAITDAEGNYRFDNLDAGGFYTVPTASARSRTGHSPSARTSRLRTRPA